MTYPGLENDQALLAANPDMAAVLERRREREEEYGEYVAVQDIPWGTVLAATPGTAVPKSTVERLKWDELGLVAKRSSKAGREVLERTDSATAEEREQWAGADRATAAKSSEKSTSATSSKGSN